MSNDPRMVLFLSFPRSGSTAVSSFLQHQPNVFSIDELFNKNRMGINQASEKITELKKIKTPLKSKLKVIEIIKKHAIKSNYKFFSFQIFYNHVKDSELEEVIDIYNPYIVFLTRRRIDANISRQKSNILKTWTNVDTTNYKLDFNFKTYEDQSKKVDMWMANTHRLVLDRKISHSTLIYEEVTEKGLKNLDDFFTKNLNANGISYKSVKIENKDLIVKKQDKATIFTKKVKNSDELKVYVKNNPDTIRPYMYSETVKNAPCSCFN